MVMDLDPTIGRPGALGQSRAATAVTTEARRPPVPVEVPREGPPRTDERDGYPSPGLRPPSDAAGDVVLELSPKALALAKAAATNTSLVKPTDDEVEADGETERSEREPSTPSRPAPRRHSRPRIDLRA